MDVLEQQEEEKRPTFLIVLCILSWIYIGVMLLLNVLGWIRGKLSPDKMRSDVVDLKQSTAEMRKIGWDGVADALEDTIPLSQQMNDNFYLVHSINTFMIIVGFIGVLWMWQGKKLGFHLYIIYCLIALVGIYAYVSMESINVASQIMGAIISAAFIFMYSRNLGWMKK